jgi:hypothetical protein
MGRAYSTHGRKGGEQRNACRILVREPEGKRSLGRPRRMRMDTIKLTLGKQDEVVWNAFIWVGIGTSGGLL